MIYRPPINQIILAANEKYRYYFILWCPEDVHNKYYLYTYFTNEEIACPFKYIEGGNTNEYLVRVPATTKQYYWHGIWSFSKAYDMQTGILVREGSGYTSVRNTIMDSSNPIYYYNRPDIFFRPNNPTKISLNKNNTTLSLKQIETLTATIEPAEATKGIYWNTSDGTVATIAIGDETADIRVLKTGSTIISASTVYISGDVVPPYPNVRCDNDNNKIIGLDDTMEYKIDSNEYIPYNNTQVLDLNGNQIVLVRKKANGSIAAGEAITLYFKTNIS